ncbi:MAG: LysR family transcriptional regulator [Pseudomonadota bacterium]
MAWQAISFDWNQVRTFLATAEEGSFSGAARVLKSTQPKVARQISELERALSVILFERSVRGPSLTHAGRDLLEHVRAMAEAATLISMIATGHSNDMSSEEAATATDLLSASVLPRILGPLRVDAPGIRVRIVASNETQNLTQRDADIAIRHVRPAQQDLIARHVTNFRANLNAASAYLDKAGRPRAPRDVAHHAVIGSPDLDRLLPALHNLEIPVRAENFVMNSQNGTVVWKLLKSGFGISLLPEPLCDAEPGV